MRLSHLLNPLQWNFGIRTVATLLTWALLPVALTAYVGFQRLRSTAATVGLGAEQLHVLETELLQAIRWLRFRS